MPRHFLNQLSHSRVMNKELEWYAIKLGPGRFGIFDTFANEAGRMPTWVAILPRHWGRGPMSYLRFLRRCKKWNFLQAHPSGVECEVATNGC